MEWLRRAGERAELQKHMMFDILISIGQVLTLYGDDFPICRRDMSGHQLIVSVKRWTSVGYGEAFEHIIIVI